MVKLQERRLWQEYWKGDKNFYMNSYAKTKKVICGIVIGFVGLLIIGIKFFGIKTLIVEDENVSQIANTEDINQIPAINTEVSNQTWTTDTEDLNEVPTIDTEVSSQTWMMDTEDLDEVLTGNTVDLENSQTISKEELCTWVGDYSFLELEATPAGSPMMMDFAIKIYKNGYADIFANGQTTYMAIRAEVHGNREEIRLIFAGCLPEDVTSGNVWDYSDVMVSFKKVGDDIYTYWGKLKDVVLLYSDQVSGKIYFTRTGAENNQNPEAETESEHVVDATETGENFSEMYEIEMEQVSLKKIEDGYELALYDKSNKKIYSEVYPIPEGSIKLPVISELSENILEISMSVGSPAIYTFFFNKETTEVSPTYFNPFIVENKYIAYIDYDKSGVLVFTDMFQRGEVYIEVARNFAPYANLIDAVIDIKIIDSNYIELQYYEGEDFVKKSEVISLDLK